MAKPVGYSDLEIERGPQILGQTYSTLQAIQPDLSLTDSQKQLTADPEKQLARYFDPYGASAPETVDGHRLYPSKSGASSNGTILGLRRRTFWIALVLSLVVIAAIVGGIVGGTHIKLYYISINGELMHTNTTDFTHWDTNPVTSSTGAAIKPANDSILAATWHNYPHCQSCSYNAFVAYQSGQTGGFEVVNASISGETRYIKLPGNPLNGSSCFFNLMWQSNHSAFLRLGYQLASGQQTGAQWNGTANAWQANETPEHHAHYSIVTPLAPMTSFSFGRGAPTEVPDYVFLLAAGEDGVSIDWWDNSDPAATVWGLPQNPAVMRGVRSLSPITANGAGHVFAFEGAVVKEFSVQPDGTTWDLVGDVTGS
ncbi:MAG: hypothetical protein Q9197_006954 [Variospora fuerteventurae]